MTDFLKEVANDKLHLSINEVKDIETQIANDMLYDLQGMDSDISGIDSKDIVTIRDLLNKLTFYGSSFETDISKLQYSISASLSLDSLLQHIDIKCNVAKNTINRFKINRDSIFIDSKYICDNKTIGKRLSTAISVLDNTINLVRSLITSYKNVRPDLFMTSALVSSRQLANDLSEEL